MNRETGYLSDEMLDLLMKLMIYLGIILIQIYTDRARKSLDILLQSHIIEAIREMWGFVSKYGGFCYKLVISAFKKAGFPSSPGKYSREVNL